MASPIPLLEGRHVEAWMEQRNCTHTPNGARAIAFGRVAAVFGNLSLLLIPGYTGIALASLTCLQLGYYSFQIFRPTTDSYVKTCLAWLRINPLFEELWESINSETPWTFRVVTEAEFVANGRMDTGSWADCSHFLHEIRVTEKKFSAIDLTSVLLFECCNAFQSSRLQSISDRSLRGDLSREEYTRLKEFTEHDSARTHDQIVKFGIHYMGWIEPVMRRYPQAETSTVQNIWDSANRPNSNASGSHSDHYRFLWNRNSSFSYILLHPEALRDHPDLVSFRHPDGGISLIHHFGMAYVGNKYREILTLWKELGGSFLVKDNQGYSPLYWLQHLVLRLITEGNETEQDLFGQNIIILKEFIQLESQEESNSDSETELLIPEI